MQTEGQTNQLTRVWDRAVRLWHWLTALGVLAMWWTAENHMMELHFTLGIVLTGGLVFRLIWGVLGSSTARFANFVKGPASVFAYLKKGPGTEEKAGHSPLGALSVLALILALSVQLITGLFATDTDGMNSGPLARFIDYDTSQAVAEFHEISFNILLGLIILHLAAILFYLIISRQNLIRPMVTGARRFRDPGMQEAGLKKPGPVNLALAALLGAACTAILFQI